MNINITINGDPHSLTSRMNLNALLQYLDIKQGKVAVEHNREIVAKTTYEDVYITDGDTLEIVHFIGGG